MKSRTELFVFFLFLLSIHNVAFGDDEGGCGGAENIFVSPESMATKVLKSEAGEFSVVTSFKVKGVQSPLHIGFIKMEPKSMLIPLYLDSTLVLFVRGGQAKIGVDKNGLVETNLTTGDIYVIPAASTFFIVNTGEGQILQMIVGIDNSEGLGMSPFQSFFIGGGIYPKSILAGFDKRTVASALNVSSKVYGDLLTRQRGGPFVFIDNTYESDTWVSSLKLNHQGSLISRKLMKSESEKSSEKYNLYNDGSPDFENEYGSSLALTQDDYPALGQAGKGGIGVYHVILTAGAMMAPHVNPGAAEIGVALKGSGRIEVVCPNGSSATNSVVNEGDAFFIPKYFPFCQVASKEGLFEIFGFTSSSLENRPQFLVGAKSILQNIKGFEAAASFGMHQREYNWLINAQNESIILPASPAAPSP